MQQDTVAEVVLLRQERGSPLGRAFVAVGRFMSRKPLGAFGAVVVTLLVLVSIFAPLLVPHDPLRIYRDFTYSPPSSTFLLGTDGLGRDVLSRIIYGSRISLYVGLVSVAIGSSIGSVLGMVSAFYGGRVDLLIQRFIDSLMAFPGLILAMALVAVLGPSIDNVVAAVATVLIPRSSRVIRSAALAIEGAEFIQAAKAIGCGDRRIIFRHILPQCVAPYIVIATATIGWAIVLEATLTFLGVGIPPPTPSWGEMLAGEGRASLTFAPWIAIVPGVALSMVAFGFNLLGDSLRDVLDPRLRR
ncbi:MAG: ABC transporter permease [Chloroflexi bacterium]|nr:ABC transporter permease [Chloroflexota bacterium]